MSELSRGSVVVIPAGGNEPGILGGRMCLAVNEQLRKQGYDDLDIIVPVAGERQSRVLADELSNEPGADRILLDPVAGAILSEILGSQADFAEHIRVLGTSFFATQYALRNRLSPQAAGTVSGLYSLTTGSMTEVNRSHIVSSIGAGGRLTLDTPHASYAFPVLVSQLIEAAMEQQGSQAPSDLQRVARLTREAERRYNNRFIPLVNTLSGSHLSPEQQMGQNFLGLLGQPTQTESGDITYTPPMKGDLPPATFAEIDSAGIYAMLSGTGVGEPETLSAAITAAAADNLSVYTVPWAPEQEGIKRVSPRTLVDPGLLAIIGRAGWGTGWQALNMGKPWLAIPPQPGDDLEIALNCQVIERLGIGTVISPDTFSAIGLRALIGEITPRVVELQDSTEAHFGTSDGIGFMAKIITQQYLETGLLP